MGPEKQFRIPTIFALLVICGIVMALATFSDEARILLGRAAQPSSVIPAQVSVFNTGDAEALIYWESEEPVASSLRLKSPTSSNRYDVRDTDFIPKQYKKHIYTLTGLPSNTRLSFDILLGKRTVYNGVITTGPALSKPPQVLPLYGSVPNDLPSDKGFLILASIGNEATTALFSNSPESWAMPLAHLRSKDQSGYYCTNDKCSDEKEIVFTFTSEGGKIDKKTTIGSSRPYSDVSVLSLRDETTSTPSGSVQKVTTSPTLTLPIKSTISPKIIPPIPTTKVLSAKSEIETNISILSPKDGQAVSFAKPLFRGEGVQGKEVLITLTGSITQIGKVRVSEKNIWQWNPGYPLSSGIYKVMIETSDKNNKKITIKRTFTVLKSGESVLSASTPSATLIPSVFPTEMPTNILSPTPTLYVTAGPALSIFFIGGGSLLLLLSLAIL